MSALDANVIHVFLDLLLVILKLVFTFELRKESGNHWSVLCITCHTAENHFTTIFCGLTGIRTILQTQFCLEIASEQCITGISNIGVSLTLCYYCRYTFEERFVTVPSWWWTHGPVMPCHLPSELHCYSLLSSRSSKVHFNWSLLDDRFICVTFVFSSARLAVITVSVIASL